MLVGTGVLDCPRLKQSNFCRGDSRIARFLDYVWLCGRFVNRPYGFAVGYYHACRGRRPRRPANDRFLLSHRRIKALIVYFSDRRGRRSLHAYLNVIIDLLDDRFLTAKQTNSTIHCRDWRPRQSAKANGSSKPPPIRVILSGAQIKCRMQSAECKIKGENFDSIIPGRGELCSPALHRKTKGASCGHTMHLFFSSQSSSAPSRSLSDFFIMSK